MRFFNASANVQCETRIFAKKSDLQKLSNPCSSHFSPLFHNFDFKIKQKLYRIRNFIQNNSIQYRCWILWSMNHKHESMKIQCPHMCMTKNFSCVFWCLFILFSWVFLALCSCDTSRLICHESVSQNLPLKRSQMLTADNLSPFENFFSPR